MNTVMILPILLLVCIGGCASQYVGGTICSQKYNGVCRKSCWARETHLKLGRRTCNSGICCVHENSWGVLSQWSEWSQCNVACETGTQSRWRRCINGYCVGYQPRKRVRACNTNKPCRASTWGPWTDWTHCSCKTGKQRRWRKCLSDPGTCDSTAGFQRRDCTHVACPMSFWSAWGTWSSCSVTCGEGSRIRRRTCGGTRCFGDDTRSAYCSQPQCTTATPTPTTTTPPNCGPLLSTTPTTSTCASSPWIVSIQIFDGTTGFSFCSGVILSASQILTTKQCSDALFSTIPGNSFRAVAGSSTLPGGQQFSFVSENDVDDSSVGGDFSVITLPQPFTLDSCALPVCLPRSSDVFAPDTSCTLAGWAIGDPNNPIALQEVSSVSLVDLDACRTNYSIVNPTFSITDNMACSTTGGTQCGETGGWGLICPGSDGNARLHGLSVVDFTSATCSNSSPLTFQDVKTYVAVIQNLILTPTPGIGTNVGGTLRSRTHDTMSYSILDKFYRGWSTRQ